jgi:putative flavoprotein involved in K+ transport
VELARERRVILAGRDTGELPFRPRSTAARFLWLPLVLRIVFRKVLSIRTPIGRARRPALVGRGGPLIRVKKRDLAAAGVERVGRVTGVREGMPVVDDGRVLDEVRNVIFCTGFETGFESWIRLPVHGGVHDHEPRHQGGIVSDQPGLYFLGLHFLRSLASGMIQGVGDDAAFVVDHLARRQGRGPGGGARVGARGMAGRPAA